ncbi:hypothetical protein SAMN02982994_6508 [Azospirillum lipoferum]|nr:hypothetical protein SAMN02982994_6508 [Azospirillum lipoferum]
MVLPVRYLQVSLSVPDNDHMCQTFEEYMRELLPTFTQTPWPGWQPVLTAKRSAQRDQANPPDTDANKHYLHVWRVSDYNSLPYLMEVFDDNPIYQHLDAMVLAETQDFFQALSYNPSGAATASETAKATFYLQVTFDVVADPTALQAFDNFMAACSTDPKSPITAQYGWTLANAYYSQTGLLRRYVQIWSTSQHWPEPADAVAWLGEQPAVKGALNTAVATNPQWMQWEPVNYGTQPSASPS